MRDRTRALVAAAGATNYHLVLADAMNFVFLANTFLGVPDRLGLARAVAAILKPNGQFGVVNWHRLPRKETVVLDKPRGPRTEMRMEADDVAVIVEPAGLSLNRTIEFPPYHYGVFREEDGLHNWEAFR